MVEPSSPRTSDVSITGLPSMLGWVIPPPKRPVKTRDQFLEERAERVRSLIREGFLRSDRIVQAMMKVPREEFIPDEYRDYAYLEVPLPIPGRQATISCPHSYPLFYEALELGEDDVFLEVGAGSGYGAAIAAEVVGSAGRVVTIDIDEETLSFARSNLERLGYEGILVVLGDGSLGYPPGAPYDKVCVTATCPRIPEPLIHQLRSGGKLIAPVGHPGGPQDLTLIERVSNGRLKVRRVEKVLYVPLRGQYGWPGYPQ